VTDPATLASMPQLTNAPGYPYVNHISGDAQYRQHIFAANFGAELTTTLSLYSFATYGKKKARPSRTTACRTACRRSTRPASRHRRPSTKKTTLSPPASRVRCSALELGPVQHLRQGRGQARRCHSANIALFTDTGATPLDFYAGKFVASQWTNNLDLNHEFDVGWATPLTFAVGLEHRRDNTRSAPAIRPRATRKDRNPSRASR
jgi:iron complex outermembrane receptor protein